jgi:hypothetical protein
LIIYLIDSNITWFKYEINSDEQFQDVSNFKIKKTAKDFVTPKSKMMLEFLEYAYSLKFEECPDYKKLKFILQKV